MSTLGPPIKEIKAAMRATWMAGDFGVIARENERAAESFVTRLGVPAAARVLDVATGTGNVAIPLARGGCRATGLDIAPNLLEQARKRAEAEGLAIAFDEGDAEQLPYPDAGFDAVVSMFGAMFAPRPELVAAEFARVLRPGGLLGMANWTPSSFAGQIFAVGARHAPPPPGLAPPVLWGDEATVRARLSGSFEEIQTQTIRLDFELPMDAAGVVAFFRRFFGPTQMAFARLDERGKVALAADLEALWASANLAEDPASQTLVRNEYLEVRARRR